LYLINAALLIVAEALSFVPVGLGWLSDNLLGATINSDKELHLSRYFSFTSCSILPLRSII
jgi:hypothetical protein